MNIRLMNENDYDNIYKMWINTSGMGLNNLDDSKDGIAKFLRRNPKTYSVAEDNGELIGVILSGNDGRRGYIYHTTVFPTEHKKGVGTALVNASLNALKKEGINKVPEICPGQTLLHFIITIRAPHIYSPFLKYLVYISIVQLLNAAITSFSVNFLNISLSVSISIVPK